MRIGTFTTEAMQSPALADALRVHTKAGTEPRPYDFKGRSAMRIRTVSTGGSAGGGPVAHRIPTQNFTFTGSRAAASPTSKYSFGVKWNMPATTLPGNR